ncbi:glycosyltransferase [Leptothrix sp. BB-4]
MNTNRKVLVLVTNPEDNLAEIRLGQPLRGLARGHGWSLRMLAFHEVNRLDLRWADVVVIQRATRLREVQLMEWLTDQGIPVIYEIDDLITEPADHVISGPDLRAHAHLVNLMLSMADVVSASTPRLVAHLAPIAKSIQLVPNYGPVEHPEQARQDDALPVTLLIAASDRQAVGPMAAGVRLIQSDPSLRVDTVAISAIADSLEEAGVSCRRLPQMPRDEFFRTVSSLTNPIGLIPLDNSPFSACKSAVKYFDYACLGVPSICSAYPPYADVIQSGQDGVLCADNPQDWADAIRRLAQSGHERQRLAGAARAKVETHYTLARTQAVWESLLTRLIEQGNTSRRSIPMAEVLESAFLHYRRMRGAVSKWNRERRKVRHARKSASQGHA